MIQDEMTASIFHRPVVTSTQSAKIPIILMPLSKWNGAQQEKQDLHMLL